MVQDLSLRISIAIATASVTPRHANDQDFEGLVRSLVADPISATRGGFGAVWDEPGCLAALTAIIWDPANTLVVTVDPSDALVDAMRLTRIQGMANLDQHASCAFE